MHLLGKKDNSLSCLCLFVRLLVFLISRFCLFPVFPRSGILLQVSFKLNISFYLSTAEVNFENCFIFSTGRYVSKWIWRYLFWSRERQVSFVFHLCTFNRASHTLFASLASPTESTISLSFCPLSLPFGRPPRRLSVAGPYMRSMFCVYRHVLFFCYS